MRSGRRSRPFQCLVQLATLRRSRRAAALRLHHRITSTWHQPSGQSFLVAGVAALGGLVLLASQACDGGCVVLITPVSSCGPKTFPFSVLEDLPFGIFSAPSKVFRSNSMSLKLCLLRRVAETLEKPHTTNSGDGPSRYNCSRRTFEHGVSQPVCANFKCHWRYYH